jgi:tetratricopeptide (TPR) repeat protein
MDPEQFGPETVDLRRLMSPEEAMRSEACPGDRTLAVLVERSLPVNEEAMLLEHIAGCDACSTRLRALEDEAFIAQLPLSTPAGQRELAARLASKQQRPVVWWAIAAAALVMLGSALWYYPRWQVSRAETLIAAEYRHGRPMPYRVADTPAGPFEQERGQQAPSAVTVPDGAPARLKWRAALLRGDYRRAIELLEAAPRTPEDASAIDNDLAIALAMRADVLGDRAAYGRPLELLNAIIHSDPNHLDARWNRALILKRAGRDLESRLDWEFLLQRERDRDWHAAAEQLSDK